MEPPIQPPPQPPTPSNQPPPDAPITIWQLGTVVLLNVVVALLTKHSWGDRRLLWLPLLNLLAGFVLLFTRYTRLGKMMLLGFLVVGLIGLGTCALLFA